MTLVVPYCLLLVIGCLTGGEQPLVVRLDELSAQPIPRMTDNERMTKDQSDKFAVIIGGVGGDPVYTKRFAEWTEAMYKLLRDRLDFAENHVYYLTATPQDISRPNAVKATAEAVRSAFKQLETRAQPHSLIFIFLVGHGSFDHEQAKVNLVGPDLTAEDLARMLEALPTKNVVVVNTTSASGAFIKTLSRSGRVVITATRSGYERNATMFAEHFIQAFQEAQADFDKNHRVSLLEAFTYAAKATAQWYERQGRLATEHALLDDNGDQVGHGEATEGDGMLARAVYLDSRPLRQATGDPELQKLVAESERLERAIEALKARKADMTAADYEAELERLLIRLAQIHQQIRGRQK